jgi:hypothetical protein
MRDRSSRELELCGHNPTDVAKLVGDFPPYAHLVARGIKHHAGVEVAYDGRMQIGAAVHLAASSRSALAASSPLPRSTSVKHFDCETSYCNAI